VRQRSLLDAVRVIRPLSYQPEAIQSAIRAAFQADQTLKALRTDIRSCFATIPQAVVEDEIGKLPLSAEIQASLCRVFRQMETGLPTGRPLSPWLAELVLSLLDREMSAHAYYFRYVDDICVLGNLEQCCPGACWVRDRATPSPTGKVYQLSTGGYPRRQCRPAGPRPRRWSPLGPLIQPRPGRCRWASWWPITSSPWFGYEHRLATTQPVSARHRMDFQGAFGAPEINLTGHFAGNHLGASSRWDVGRSVTGLR